MGGDPTAAALSLLEPHYEVLREIGRGGTALVYLARERSTGAEVAIKLIRAKYIEDEETVARFAREARYVGKLNHPNVVALRAVVELGDLGLAIVMDHIRGKTLKQTIQESGPLSPLRAELVLRDIALALRAAHSMGIVHRDVKPENIFIDTDGHSLLADFGVARSMTNETQLTMSGIAIGTPAYMAPEQIDGLSIDGRSDIYSLGLVGWEMITGKRPWDGSSLYAVIYQQKHEELPDVRDLRPETPDHLAEVIAGAIEKDRATRWQSAEELIVALDGNAKRRAPRTRPPISDDTQKFVRLPEEARPEEPVPVDDSVHATLAEILATEFDEPERSLTTRRLVGAGVVGLLLVAGGVYASQGRIRIPGRSTGEVAIGTQAGVPAVLATAPGGRTDTTKRFTPADPPKPETVVAIGPALAVAQASADPSLTRLLRSTDVGTGVRELASDSVQSGSTTTAQTTVARDSAPAVAESRAPPVSVPRVDTSRAPSTVMTRPTAPTTRVSIATGGSHTCLLMVNGRAFCWGGNDRGQLGSGNTTRPHRARSSFQRSSLHQCRARAVAQLRRGSQRRGLVLGRKCPRAARRSILHDSIQSSTRCRQPHLSLARCRCSIHVRTRHRRKGMVLGLERARSARHRRRGLRGQRDAGRHRDRSPICEHRARMVVCLCARRRR
jgi:tRNA A-37 threonylcarbamoyl transferase component Bud32